MTSGGHDFTDEAALNALTADMNKDGVPDVYQFETCPSCGEPHMQLFCANCGLKNDNCRRSVFKLGAEAIGSFFAWDGRMWRTLIWLFTKPGRVAREFADGKRTQFSSPIRVYLVASFLFAALMSVTNTYFFMLTFNAPAEAVVSDVDAPITIGGEQIDGLKVGFFYHMDPATIETLQENGRELRERRLRERLRQEELGVETETAEAGCSGWKINGRCVEGDDFAAAINMNPTRFNDRINAWLPWIMFTMAPFAAFFGALFIRGRGNALIYDHIIHSVYLHALVFMCLIIAVLLSRVISGTWVLTFFVTYFAWYVPKATRNMFGRGWFKTMWASFWVSWFYMWIIFWILLAIGVFTMADILDQENLLTREEIAQAIENPPAPEEEPAQ